MKLPGWGFGDGKRMAVSYAVAVVGTLALVAGQFWAWYQPIHTPALTLFLLPILISAYLGGLGPGLVSTALASLGTIYFLLAPIRLFSIEGELHSARWFGLVVSGILASVLCEGFHREIVERGRAEEKLRASEGRLDAILGSAMDGIVSVDEQHLVTFFNPAAEKMFKCSAREVMGQPLDRFIPQRFQTSHSNHIRAFGQTHTTRRTMGQLGSVFGVRSDGKEFPVEASISHSEVSGKKLFTAILRDVTERQRAEAAVQEQAALLDQSYDALFVWELDGGITFWNSGAEALYGYPRSEALGKISHQLLHTNLEGGIEGLHRALERDGLWEGELQHQTHEGRWITGDSRMVVTRHPRGGRVFEIVRDITERKRAEEEIRTLNAELERRVKDRTTQLESANKELEAFTYSVSHDLRAPLRHIDGFSNLLSEEYGAGLPVEASEYISIIRDSVRQMGMLIDDLLNLGRVGRAQLNMRVTGLNSIAEEVIADLKRSNADRVIEWKVQTLPFVDCDPGLMKQVFANLISNAVKFTRPRNPAVVEVGAAAHDGARAIFVRDNGVGFSMKYVNKLFGVFQRLHRSEDFEGTGVGLATVQRIVHKHGGSVWAEAELDKGATFYFTLGSPDEDPQAAGN